MRIALVALCAIALAAVATFIITSEKTIAARRAKVQEFDAQAREAIDALGDLRAAQQAYVAVGQGNEFWMSKVDATTQAIGRMLPTLQQSASSDVSKAALDEAVSIFAEFRSIDGRIRGYLRTSAQLMAADIVFTEGGEAAANAAHVVEKARLEEHVSFDRADAVRRRQAVEAAGGAAALMLLALIVLAPRSAAASTPIEATAIDLNAVPEASPAAPPMRGGELLLRQDAPVESTPPPAVITAPVEPPASAAALAAAARLCTDIGRVNDVEELKALVGRAAELLDASGLVLWLASLSGEQLRPALSHGYPPDTVSRIPPVPRAADNAAAAAYRTGTLQVVRSRSGSPAKGAIVAPVLSPDGCIGVLSAEIRGGGEASDTIQALAAIIAAQLGSVVAATPAQNDARAAGGSAI
jgi:GAF domain